MIVIRDEMKIYLGGWMEQERAQKGREKQTSKEQGREKGKRDHHFTLSQPFQNRHRGEDDNSTVGE